MPGLIPRSPTTTTRTTTCESVGDLEAGRRWAGPGNGRLARGRGNRPVRLIDQTRLPTEFVRADYRDVSSVWEAIRLLRVRARQPSASPRRTGAVLGGQPRWPQEATPTGAVLLAAAANTFARAGRRP